MPTKAKITDSGSVDPAAPFITTLDAVLVKLRQDLEGVAEQGSAGASFEDLIATVRRATDRAGLEVLRAAIEALDAPLPALDRDGDRLRYRGTSTKQWLTPLGLMMVERRMYSTGKGGGSFAALDARVGMTGRFLAPQVEELACFAAASMTPCEVETLLEKALPQAPSATAIKRAVQDVGGLLETHRDDIEVAIEHAKPLPTDGDVVVASWDGCMLPMRREGRAEWKEAGVGRLSVYRHGEERPEMIDSRCYGRMPEPSMTTLVDQVVEAVANLRARDGIRELAVICDGKPSIWAEAKRRPELEGATLVLDFYHAMEHVAAATAEIADGNEVAAERLRQKWREKLQLEPGAIDKIIRSLGRYAREAGRGSKKRATLLRIQRHFRNNRARMRYADCIARGIPIGSGPVEAACKTLVQTRLKRSGMRWSTTGGQHVLNLRSLVKSDRWDEGWSAVRQMVCAA